MRDKYDFLHEDKHQNFLQGSSLVFTGHSQTCPKYPNRKFVISLQDLKKEGRDKVHFLHVDKYKTIPRGYMINLGGHGQACPNYSK